MAIAFNEEDELLGDVYDIALARRMLHYVRPYRRSVIVAIVLLIGMTFGYNCGYAINPARDFGPRLFTAMAGWGSKVFTANDYFWWVPIVGPCIGGVLGGLIYDVLVTCRHPPESAAQ